jgi:hypothetical protein
MNNPASQASTLPVSTTEVAAAAEGNLPLNGDFSNGGTSWTGKYTAPASGSFTYSTGTAKFTITTAGTQNYFVQFYQPVPVTAGVSYCYSFRARKLTTGTRTINFVVETNASPYDKDIEQELTIRQAPKRLSSMQRLRAGIRI